MKKQKKKVQHIKMTMSMKKFVDELITTGNRTQAYKIAYPQCKKDTTAQAASSRLLTNVIVCQYYKDRLKEIEDASIAKPIEVMQYFTKVMRGEVRDQFDLDPSIKDRNDAGSQLMRRYEVIQKFKFDERKLVIAEKAVQDNDEDIEYVVEEPTYEDEEKESQV